MVVLNLKRAYELSKFEITPEDIQERLGIGEDGYEALLAGELEITLDMLAELSDLYNLVVTDLIDFDTIKFGVLDCSARRIRGRSPKVVIDMDFHLKGVEKSITSHLRLVHTGEFEVNTGFNLGLDLKFVVNFSDLGVATHVVGLNETEKRVIKKVLEEYVGYAIKGVFSLSGYKQVKVSIVGI